MVSKKKTFLRRWGLVLLLSCTGCRTTPPPAFFEPPAYALTLAQQATFHDPLVQRVEKIPPCWWEIFQDPQLTLLIQKSWAKNPSLESAKANILLAVATAESVRSSLFPTIYLGGDVAREKLSKTGVIPFGDTDVPLGTADHIPIYFTQYETQLNLVYDFDLWGKNRNTLYAALGEVRAQAAEKDFTKLQLGIGVAQVYYHLQTLYQRQQWALNLVHNRSLYVDLRKKRVDQSLDNALVLESAKIELSEAEQRLLEVEENIAVAEHQLQAYVADQFEEKICALCPQPLPKVPLPVDLPLHLLSHRPDIQAQLWLIESAGRQIEVARAGFYPDFNIKALFGFQTIHFHDLFRWPSSYFNIDPAFTLPLFDGGLLLANLKGSEVNYNLAILDYNALVIQAVQETLDGISLLLNKESRLVEYQKKRSYQEESTALTKLRVENSLDTYLDYLSSEEKLLLAYDSEITSHGEALQAILQLIKALGGGYECQP